jgi:hypothetical protein
MAAVFFSDPNRFLGRKYLNDGLPQPNSAVIIIRILPLREFRKQISARVGTHRPRHAQELLKCNIHAGNASSASSLLFSCIPIPSSQGGFIMLFFISV